MEQLRIHVERIVRPIRASGLRKNKTRKELLGHLVQSSWKHLAQLDTEDAAFRAAIEGLGDPDEIRRELQTGVPTLEKLLHHPLPWLAIGDRWFDKEEDESTIHYVLHRTADTTIYVACVIAGFVALLRGLMWASILPERAYDASTRPLASLATVLLLLLLQALATAVSYFVLDISGFRSILSKKSFRPAWQRAAALLALIAGYLALFLTPAILFVSIAKPSQPVGDVFARLVAGSNPWGVAGIAALILLFLFAFLGWAMNKEHEHYQEWGRLQIDE